MKPGDELREDDKYSEAWMTGYSLGMAQARLDAGSKEETVVCPLAYVAGVKEDLETAGYTVTVETKSEPDDEQPGWAFVTGTGTGVAVDLETLRESPETKARLATLAEQVGITLPQ